MKCECNEYGYCTYTKSVEEQEESETFWECDGTEKEQENCGRKKKE